MTHITTAVLPAIPLLVLQKGKYTHQFMTNKHIIIMVGKPGHWNKQCIMHKTNLNFACKLQSTQLFLTASSILEESFVK